MYVCALVDQYHCKTETERSGWWGWDCVQCCTNWAQGWSVGLVLCIVQTRHRGIWFGIVYCVLYQLSRGVVGWFGIVYSVLCIVQIEQ